MTNIVKATRFGASASERLNILGETLLFAGAHAKASLKRRYASDMVAKAPRDYQTEIDVAVERRSLNGSLRLSPTMPSRARSR